MRNPSITKQQLEARLRPYVGRRVVIRTPNSSICGKLTKVTPASCRIESDEKGQHLARSIDYEILLNGGPLTIEPAR